MTMPEKPVRLVSEEDQARAERSFAAMRIGGLDIGMTREGLERLFEQLERHLLENPVKKEYLPPPNALPFIEPRFYRTPYRG